MAITAVMAMAVIMMMSVIFYCHTYTLMIGPVIPSLFNIKICDKYTLSPSLTTMAARFATRGRSVIFILEYLKIRWS